MNLECSWKRGFGNFTCSTERAVWAAEGERLRRRNGLTVDTSKERREIGLLLRPFFLFFPIGRLSRSFHSKLLKIQLINLRTEQKKGTERAQRRSRLGLYTNYSREGPRHTLTTKDSINHRKHTLQHEATYNTAIAVEQAWRTECRGSADYLEYSSRWLQMEARAS
jgi:hypothetical protein